MGNKNKSSSQNESINPYEKERMKILEANAAKMKARGFNKSLLNKTLQEKYDLVSKNIAAELSEPEELVEELHEVPKRVNCSRDKNGKKVLTQTLPMAEFMKLKNRERQQKTRQAKAIQANLGQHKENDVNELPPQVQANQQTQLVPHQEPSKNLTQHKGSQQKQNQQSRTSLNQHQKSYCAPGTMSRYVNMRKNQGLSGQGMNTISDIQQPHDSHLSNDEIDGIEDDENSYNIEAEAPNAVDGNENRATEKKKHRGRTHLGDIHMRTLEERDVLFLNDLRQVVGPRHIVQKFARFLGTLARNHNLAPLNVLSWHYMPTKDKLWEYVQSKYILPEEAKEVVLSDISSKWRNHKSDLKDIHFSEDATWEEMWDKRPKDVPECQFKELLDFWNTKEAREMSQRNKDNRAKQSDMHTMGPTSIAMLRYEMQQNDPEKRCPSQADLYIESRKRNVGRTYLTQGDETLQNIEKMKALQSLDNGSTKSDPYYDVMGKKEHSGRLRMYGLGVTKSRLKNKDPKNPFILPPMLLDTISEQLEKKLEEVDKRLEERFEQKLVDMLSKIREANPGVDLVIPDMPTNEEGASSSHQN